MLAEERYGAYSRMSDDELLQLVRTYAEENGREPTKKDLSYSSELKKRFGPWNRMLEKAGTRQVSAHYLEKRERRRQKRCAR